MKKIKVLRIIARLNVGGPAIHVAILSAGLDKERFETVLVCGALGRGEADMSDYARSLGVVPRYISGLGRDLSLFGDLAAFLNLFRLIAGEQPDIIHTHTAKAGALARSAAVLHNFFRPARRKIKLVHTFHGHVFNGYFNPFISRFFLLVEKILARFTDCIVTVSPALKDDLVARRVCAAQKISVIPLGFDLERLLRVQLPQGRAVNIGIIGRLEPVKNHHLFLEAAAILAARRPDLKFKVIGGGTLGDELMEYARLLGVAEKIEFTGWQRGLAAVYSGLDIIALTSVNEGTPVSLIEAMACGRPVVATDVGGVPDLLGPVQADADSARRGRFETCPYKTVIGGGFSVGKRGILVSSRSPAAFAAALEYLLDNEEIRERFALNGREFVRDNFSKERLIKDMEELYRRLVS